MDFTSTANANGPDDPANISLRGPDPLFALPPGHPFRNAGLKLVATPGGLIAALDNVHSSEVESILIPALRPDANLRASGFLLRPPTPQKLQAVLAQLAAEPPPHRLNLNASYSSVTAIASAVADVVSHLDPNNLSPVYTCTHDSPLLRHLLRAPGGNHNLADKIKALRSRAQCLPDAST